MPATVSIPVNEMNEFGLPRVCVMTGSNDNVSFRPAKFAWVPPGVRAAAIIPILYLILASINTQKVNGTLPFSEEGWAVHQRAKIMQVVAGFSVFVLLVLGVFLVDVSGALALLVFIAAIAFPVFLGLKFVRNKIPTVVKVENGRLELKIPSESAAQAINARLGRA